MKKLFLQTIIYWFLFVNILINNFLENFSILFYQEKIQYSLFISLFFIPAFILSVIIHKLNINRLTSIMPLFIFISSILFWQYSGLVEIFFNFFNNIDNSGIISVIILYGFLLILSYKFREVFSVKIFISILIVVQSIGFLTPYISNFISTIGESQETLKNIELSEFTTKPDIYMFLFDAMAPNRVLNELYEDDQNYNINKFNSAISPLQDFENTFSSYGGTAGQVKSIFNLEHFSEKQPIVSMNTNMFNNDTHLERYLVNSGYEIIKSGVIFNCKEDLNTTCISSGFVVNPVVRQIILQTPLYALFEKNLLPELFLDSTFGRYLFKNTCGFINQTSECQKVSLVDGLGGRFEERPKFYWIHLMLTHEPFVVDSNCNFYESVNEGFDFEKYYDSISCAYSLIEEINSKLSDEALVIIQSDHGPNIEPRDRTNLNQLRPDYLNYYYSIISYSNINNYCSNNVSKFGGTTTFQVVINCLTGENIFEIEENYYYMLKDGQYYEFIDITTNELFIKK